MESHDYIDGMALSVDKPTPPSQEQPVIFKYRYTDADVFFRRWVLETYHRLIESDYEVVEDYYLVRYEEEELIEAIINETRYRRSNEENLDGQRLTFNDIQQIRAAIQADQDEYDDLSYSRIRLMGHLPLVLPVIHELWRTMPPRLAELNIELCKECLMPVNPSDLTDEVVQGLRFLLVSPPNGRSSNSYLI
ncbi:unnamed protein product [Rhizophagus irregularis]|nr:unnamed protein product [Rhizophagus irregularis]